MKSSRVDGDPIGAEKARGKHRYQRKSGRDPGFTPTEQHHKNQLMRQFQKNKEGSPNSEAYRNSPAWCPTPGCKRLAGGHGHDEDLDAMFPGLVCR